MSLMKKILSSVGIGAAAVDTKLEEERLTAGSDLKGIVDIKGGSVEQSIDGIYLFLMTKYEQKVDDKKITRDGVIDQFQLSESFVVQPEEQKQIPFSFPLADDVPLTVGKTRVWVHTGLDIKQALDPADRDFIQVLPNELMSSTFQALDELGFQLRQAECEQAPRHIHTRLPFIQEFEFVPVSGPFRGKLDELEVVFLSQSDKQLDMILEIDRRGRGLAGMLSEALDVDESRVRMSIGRDNLSTLSRDIKSVIDRYS
jgi:sporulation-control protein